MDRVIQEKLDALDYFYRDKARFEKNSFRSSLYQGYADGIRRAKTEIIKQEEKELAERNEREIL